VLILVDFLLCKKKQKQKQKQKPKRKKEKEKEDMYYNKHIVNVYFVINQHRCKRK
jgi:hypothetical protein